MELHAPSTRGSSPGQRHVLIGGENEQHLETWFPGPSAVALSGLSQMTPGSPHFCFGRNGEFRWVQAARYWGSATPPPRAPNLTIEKRDWIDAGY
jgi:hypothetical protein